ncbi:MAG: response regulator transcription factor [Thermodesulfobacteriota bacterium]
MGVKKRILIVDDHPVVREGLKSIIARGKAFEVVGEAGESREALGSALKLKPDIMLVDISLPDGEGTELVREIRMVLPNVIVLMVSVHRESHYIAGSFQAGAAGYFVKGSVPGQLLEALEVVSGGGYYFEAPMSPEDVEQIKNLQPEKPDDPESRYESLTRRQKEVMKLLAQGLPYKTIAERLHISETTVSHHRAQIMGKLGIRNRAELLQLSIGLGLVDTGP